MRYGDDVEDLSSPHLSLKFRLSGNQIEEIKQANSNNVLTFALDAAANSVEMQLDPGPQGNITSANGIGLLHFRHSEVMDNGRYIVAGTFGFVVDDESGYYKVRSGRFDFRFRI